MMLILRRFLLYSTLVATLSIQLAGQPDVATVGPRVGAAAPAFSGVDQFGVTHSLQSSLGPNGVMLVFFRSADW